MRLRIRMNAALPIVCTGIALALAPELSFAQAPKVDSRTYYVDDSDLGFKVKVPKDWEFIPSRRQDQVVIGSYVPPHNKMIDLGPDNRLMLGAWLLKFDRRPQALGEGQGPGEAPIELEYDGVLDWISDNMPGSNWREHESDDLRCKDRDVPATEQVFLANGRGKDSPEIKVYAAVYSLNPEVEVALLFNGPGAKKKWRKYISAFEKMGKSLQRVEVQEQPEALLRASGLASPRAKERARLISQLRREPGWKLYETDNYLIVSSNEDEDFIEELMERVEKIRAIYAQDYPTDKARRVPEPSARRAGGKLPEATRGDSDRDRSRSVPSDPFEEARASVIRVCKNEGQYHAYGGPPQSAGYWSSGDRELVIFDDQAGGGREDTWSTLNHEAFHQFIYYFYGKLAPHSWYNEGTGDFYAGYKYKHRRFSIKPFDWRVTTVKEMIRTDDYVPLEEFVTWSKKEYYGQNDYGSEAGKNYAQGWSLIYFMRRGSQESRRWEEEWDGILSTYLDALSRTGDLDNAIEAAFEGVDWSKLEAAWKDYIG